MPFEGLKYFIADGAAFLAQRIVHPYPIAANIDPATPFEIGKVP